MQKESENYNANKLINEKSPYLLQHAHNPVDWYPWNDEAFAKAKAEDKPIFLSIGYSTCHWCHVMEREAFEDEEVVALLNRDYISIKVDREERPDIDHIYMNVCQALTGHGGWPLTIIMAPDKKPFFAATYLPKHSRSQLSGMMTLLPKIASLWKNERETVIQSSDEVFGILRSFSASKGSENLSLEIAHKAFNTFEDLFDEKYGGFGQAPKFPSPHQLYFLLRYYHISKNKSALEMVEKTLEAMYRGGIYDHIGFGFSRYSTDSKWLAPHFEKMLYDNALLAIAYLEAYQLSQKEIYARIAREIFTYIQRDMISPEGGFYSAEDADSEGVEGKFYLWSREEIIQILGEEAGSYYSYIYNISEKGNFEGKNIPNLILGNLEEDERAKIDDLRIRLFDEREKRIHPFKDDKILTSWNGLMMAAFAYGARVLDEPSYLETAKNAWQFIVKNLQQEDGRLLARYRDGEADYLGYAADYAYLIWALIEMYQSSLDLEYLNLALKYNGDFMEYFWDDEQGGFFFYAKDAEQLLVRPKEIYDGALPADNSVAVYNLLRLSKFLVDEKLKDFAHKSIGHFARNINRNPSAHTFFLCAQLWDQYPGQEIVIVAKDGIGNDLDSQEMIKAINKKFMPHNICSSFSETLKLDL